ncbi:MAG: glycosyltransferase, partial [Deltaproteobacteria bacterium]
MRAGGEGAARTAAAAAPQALPASLAGLRVALAHDWLTGRRGGERLLERLCGLFPDAPIYTLI